MTPRDALMVAMGKKTEKISYRTGKRYSGGTVLLIGWLLGAKVGIGTVIAVFA